MSWTAVGLFARGNLASDETWCRHRGVLYSIWALMRVSTSRVYFRWLKRICSFLDDFWIPLLNPARQHPVPLSQRRIQYTISLTDHTTIPMTNGAFHNVDLLRHLPPHFIFHLFIHPLFLVWLELRACRHSQFHSTIPILCLR